LNSQAEEKKEPDYKKIDETREQLFEALFYIINIDGLDEYAKVIKQQNSEQQALYGFFTIHQRYADKNLTKLLKDMSKLVPKLQEITEIVKDNSFLGGQILQVLMKKSKEKED
jgi:hypothetical protein